MIPLLDVKTAPIWGCLFLAEAVRFELTEGYKPSVLFKSTALNRSATLPFSCDFRRGCGNDFRKLRRF